MRLIVQKFGGTSVATLDRIKNVAEIIARRMTEDGRIIAVVSAMAGVTNKFVEYARSMDSFEGDPEYDHVVSSGELVTAGLLAIALKNIGIKSRSYASWQVPIFTNNNYGHAVIHKIDPGGIKKDAENGVVPVICGFQGVSDENRITTLGRGGSDLTAVAVAASVNASLCEIYSDVDGVYTVDPNLYSEARRIEQISYKEMLEMASRGAKVLQEQSVDYAMRKGVVIRVASSFINGGGTIISKGVPSRMFCGLSITHNLSQICVTYGNERDDERAIAVLESNFVHCDIFRSGLGQKITLLVDKNKVQSSLNMLSHLDFVYSAKQEFPKKRFSRASVIGSSFSEENSEHINNVLKHNKIEVCSCSKNSNCINFVIPSAQLMETVSILHKHCGLDK